jgi:hypothetical protein
MWSFYHSIRAALRFHDYKPKPLTLLSARRWIKQFEKQDQKHAALLLESVIYLSEKDTRRILVEQNEALMTRLARVGIPSKKLIYVQVHDPGSSSPVMLNLLRDASGLEKRGCRFIDSRDSYGLTKLTTEVKEGALIYVDDFVGTGNQFCEARDFAMKNVLVTTFSEFLLVTSICEEAIYKIAAKGIEAFAGHVHSKAERPLHDNSNILDGAAKERLRTVCKGISPRMSLGYKDLATMVVLYRNAPNSSPAVLRGCINQTPFAGIFPRTTDLPLRRLG